MCSDSAQRVQRAGEINVVAERAALPQARGWVAECAYRVLWYPRKRGMRDGVKGRGKPLRGTKKMEVAGGKDERTDGLQVTDSQITPSEYLSMSKGRRIHTPVKNEVMHMFLRITISQRAPDGERDGIVEDFVETQRPLARNRKVTRSVSNLSDRTCASDTRADAGVVATSQCKLWGEQAKDEHQSGALNECREEI